MSKPHIALRLRDRLGPDASEDLINAFEEAQKDMVTLTTDRFERRLIAVSSELRQDMAAMDTGIRVALIDGLSKLRTDMSAMRADILLWSFLFWMGQVAAIVAILGFMLRAVAR